MGHAAAYDLIRSPRVEQVIVADKNVDKLKALEERLADAKIVPVELDITGGEKELVQLLSRCDVALSCLPAEHNYELAKTALKARCHFCDLGGSSSGAEKEFLLGEVAKEQGVTIIPELGLAPGLVSILSVAAADNLDELYEIRIRAGAVPVEPEEPMTYNQVFAIDGLIAQYAEDATVIRDGKTFELPALTDVEKIEFSKPFGAMEAFHTSGGVRNLAHTFSGKVQHLDYKTIRYPGHCSQMSLIKDLGLLGTESIKLPSGSSVSPREVFSTLLDRALPKAEPDAVLMRITVTGVRENKPVQVVWECIDYSDQAEGISALARMTAFPASVIAQMIARGDIAARGVLHQETAVPAKLLLAELASRGVTVTMAERAPVPHGS